MTIKTAAQHSKYFISGAQMAARTSVHGGVRCFVSIDLVGSTAYKIRKLNQDWITVIVDFLNRIPVQSITAESLGIQSLRKYQTPLHLWRISGDETLFYTERLVTSKQINYVFQVLYRAVQYLDKKYMLNHGLGVKATMWLAGFPYRNKEFLVSSQAPYVRFINGPFDSIDDYFRDTPFERTDERLDFLGPEVDVGFRLCALASPGRIVVSFDAANHIADSGYHDDAPVQFYHVGWQPLRGLYGEAPYPIFWLEALKDGASPQPRTSFEEATSAFAARLFDPNSQITPTKVQNLYKKYCKESEGKLMEMYIDDEHMPDYLAKKWEVISGEKHAK